MNPKIEIKNVEMFNERDELLESFKQFKYDEINNLMFIKEMVAEYGRQKHCDLMEKVCDIIVRGASLVNSNR